MIHQLMLGKVQILELDYNRLIMKLQGTVLRFCIRTNLKKKYYFRYLRVPSVPCSGDSALSSLSGHIISGPPTPGTISSSSSIDDMCNLSEENRK